MPVHSYTIRSFDARGLEGAKRAELVFTGVEQAGPSFEGRVFLNNPDADESTARDPASGYAGSFHVYGYGTTVPPAMEEAQERRQPGDEAVAPIEKRVQAEEGALRSALERSGDLTVTVVSVPVDPGGATPDRPFGKVEIVFDRADD
jgi:hypothetical protein